MTTIQVEVGVIFLLEGALDLISTKIDEVLSDNGELGEADHGTAGWSDIPNLSTLVVKETDGSRVKSGVNLNSKISFSRMFNLRRDAINFRTGYTIRRYRDITESTSNVSCIRKVRTDDLYFCTTLRWTLVWLGFEEEWRLVVMIEVTIIGTILSIW
jgi:hypothetical protein